MISFWQKKFCYDASRKSRLKYLRHEFLPLDRAPHPIWTSCSPSASQIRATIIQAKLLLGTYRSDHFISKYTGGSGACSLPGCSALVVDRVHLLSGACPALRGKLQQTTSRNLNILRSFPNLYKIVLSKLSLPPEDCVGFLLDPSSSPEIISVRQLHGIKSIYTVFRFSRSIVWTMHREHYRLKGLSHYLFH